MDPIFSQERDPFISGARKMVAMSKRITAFLPSYIAISRMKKDDHSDDHSNDGNNENNNKENKE